MMLEPQAAWLLTKSSQRQHVQPHAPRLGPLLDDRLQHWDMKLALLNRNP